MSCHTFVFAFFFVFFVTFAFFAFGLDASSLGGWRLWEVVGCSTDVSTLMGDGVLVVGYSTSYDRNKSGTWSE